MKTRSGRPLRGNTEHLRGFSRALRTISVGGYASDISKNASQLKCGVPMLLPRRARTGLKARKSTPTILEESYQLGSAPTRGNALSRGEDNERRAQVLFHVRLRAASR